MGIFIPQNPFSFIQDHVESGIVITGDSVGVNKNYSATAGIVWIGGKRLSVAAVSAVTVTASKDRYIAATDNGDGTAVLSTTANEVNNNATSPSLPANSIWVGIVVAGATTIAAATSINQGQETMVLPIISSVPVSVTDTAGNLICPRDPLRRTLGYRQKINTQSGIGTTVTQVTELSVPVIIPTGRKIEIYAHIPKAQPGVAFGSNLMSIWDGTVGSGTQLQEDNYATNNQDSTSTPMTVFAETTPTATSKTYNLGAKNSGTGGSTTGLVCAATSPGYMRITLA